MFITLNKKLIKFLLKTPKNINANIDMNMMNKDDYFFGVMSEILIMDFQEYLIPIQHGIYVMNI